MLSLELQADSQLTNLEYEASFKDDEYIMYDVTIESEFKSVNGNSAFIKERGLSVDLKQQDNQT